jgi:ankyrin repeat protein
MFRLLTRITFPITLLKILLGRQSLTRSSIPPRTSTTASDSTAPPSLSTPAVPSDLCQQQIIEYIRSRDVQAFITYIEQNKIDINYTDNVGQTMLNWVSAFGTHEMVEYLCRRGVDVNRGQRSSSLHYAASFGHPSIIRLLLKYGGNVDLRDEDGRTALDKAHERQDENHQETVDILQSAHEQIDTKQTLVLEQTKGDREIQSIYLEHLLSIFCQLYQNTMILTIKRSTLRLISKLLQYATIEQIHRIKILTTLFELLSTILDINDDNDDTANLVLLVIKTLFEKDRYLFLEQFQYLGLISKITSLALSHKIINKAPEQLLAINIISIDAKDILCNRPYVWNEFNFLRSRECLYIWNNFIIIELSIGSNGWFRFVANNSLSTMYSSGLIEFIQKDFYFIGYFFRKPENEY